MTNDVVKMRVSSKLLDDMLTSDTLRIDFMNLTYATIFVFIFFIYSLRSVFLAFFAVMLIILNCGFENLVSRGIFQITYTNFEIEAINFMITIAIVSSFVF
jgi:hypothetical protein